jgi:RecB family exonuclease
VDVERGFGTEAPLALDVDGRTLHVRGYIDRLDATRERTVVRDLKSGRAYPRQGTEAGPVPQRDVQLGLYQRVVVDLARDWNLPPRAVVAYAYASGRGEASERRFDHDVEVLERATTRWLALAAGLLAGHKFPSTPDESDCGYCPFAPLCGSEEPGRAAAGLLAEEDTTLRAFGALKRREDVR